MSGSNGHENHEKQFTGWWIPAEIVELIETGELTALELVLLATIDSFVKRGDQRLGCYASNAYLAKKIGLKNANSVGNMISRLRKKKLIRQVGYDGIHRYLETRWNRVKRKHT